MYLVKGIYGGNVLEKSIFRPLYVEPYLGLGTKSFELEAKIMIT